MMNSYQVAQNVRPLHKPVSGPFNPKPFTKTGQCIEGIRQAQAGATVSGASATIGLGGMRSNAAPITTPVGVGGYVGGKVVQSRGTNQMSVTCPAEVNRRRGVETYPGVPTPMDSGYGNGGLPR
jgi:hypothetical protein